MAGPITHAIFGREVLRQLEDQEIQQFLHNNSVAYHWGLQGPDPYFTVLKGDNGMIGVFGLMMHLKETERSFEAIGRYLLEHRDDPMFDSLLAFGMGYLGHYALEKRPISLSIRGTRRTRRNTRNLQRRTMSMSCTA